MLLGLFAPFVPFELLEMFDGREASAVAGGNHAGLGRLDFRSLPGIGEMLGKPRRKKTPLSTSACSTGLSVDRLSAPPILPRLRGSSAM